SFPTRRSSDLHLGLPFLWDDIGYISRGILCQACRRKSRFLGGGDFRNTGHMDLDLGCGRFSVAQFDWLCVSYLYWIDSASQLTQSNQKNWRLSFTS